MTIDPTRVRAAAVPGSEVLAATELQLIDAYWRACNYVAAGMIYLRDNPLLREPLRPEHLKRRLLGHWGSSPGLAFVYVHVNRLIRRHDVDAIFLAGPGHGAPGVLGSVYLEGTYSEVYPQKGEDLPGLQRFFHDFSFPGGVGSHCTPETPGSIHEGGELGYSVSHAFGAAFDNPDLLVTVVVGDGEAETGPLATAWHSTKFLNPVRDGAVLPVLHLNGYKINNPTLLARIPHDELAALFRGYGWTPHFVEGDDPATMHCLMAETLERCYIDIKAIQESARQNGKTVRPSWPMIILRSPKGWTGPKKVDGYQVEGTWRAHQVPLTGVRENPAHLAQLEAWLRSYRPDTLFDESGKFAASLKDLAPLGDRRMSANPHANGGRLRRPLDLPDFRNYAVKVELPGRSRFGNTRKLGEFLRDILSGNPGNFRVFGPDETSSNKLDAVYAASKKTWMADFLPADADGGELAQDGRVMELLSEPTLEGWLAGCLLAGRHGFLSTYEAFVRVIDFMFNQHAKWLIHRLSYRRTNHDNLHVRGYKEKGSINTPLELAIRNEVDRFSLAIDVIDRVPRLKVAGAHVKALLEDRKLDCLAYAHAEGVDRAEAQNWTWQRAN